jgi:hypothetical protein
MIINKLSEDLISNLLIEIRRNNNIEKIQIGLINPLLQYSFTKLYPYILVTSIIFFLIFIVGIIILFLLIKIQYYGKGI